MVASGLTVTGNWQKNHIWGSDGTDTIFGEGGYDLIGGGAGDDDIHGGGDTDTLRGDAGNDVLHGDDGRDYLDGGADNDRLAGGAGYDHLIGGGGADVFEFVDIGNSSASEPDLILDFSHAQGDVMDLSAIDAAMASSTDDSFQWLSTGAFTGREDELRYSVVDGGARIEGDVDGDSSADFAIMAAGVTNLVQSDFLL